MSATWSIYLYEGDYDQENSKLTVKSEFKMKWGDQEMDVRQRIVFTFVSDDEYKMEIISPYPGMPGIPEEGIKEVEIIHTRKKDG